MLHNSNSEKMKWVKMAFEIKGAAWQNMQYPMSSRPDMQFWPSGPALNDIDS